MSESHDDHVPWLRLMAGVADPFLYPQDVRDRFRAIALELEQKTRALDEIVGSAWEQATSASSRIVSLDPLLAIYDCGQLSLELSLGATRVGGAASPAARPIRRAD